MYRCTTADLSDHPPNLFNCSMCCWSNRPPFSIALAITNLVAKPCNEIHKLSVDRVAADFFSLHWVVIPLIVGCINEEIITYCKEALNLTHTVYSVYQMNSERVPRDPIFGGGRLLE